MKTESKLILMSFGNHSNTAAYNVGLGRSFSSQNKTLTKETKTMKAQKLS